MRNKKFTILLLGILLIGITGCGTKNDNLKATIIDNEGNTVKITSDELSSSYSNNPANYKSKYYGASIEFTGIIEKIRDVATEYYIDLEEGWSIVLNQKKSEDLVKDLNKGDKIQGSSNIEYKDSSTGNIKIYGMNCKGSIPCEPNYGKTIITKID